MAVRHRPPRLLKAVADVCVYAPIGFLIEAPHLVPKLVETGRDRLHRQLPARPTPARRRRPGAPARGRGGDQAATAAEPAQEAASSAEHERGRGVVAPGATSTPGEARVAEPVGATETGESGGAGGAVDGDDTGELPIPGYDQLAASQVVARLNDLDPADLLVVEAYETSHRQRRTILNRIAHLRGT